MEDEPNPFVRFSNKMFYILDAPVTFVREKIVTPNQKKYPYYHQKFRKVPEIHECYEDDGVCRFEAQQQFLRQKDVDSMIVNILRQRHEACVFEDYNQREGDKCNAMYKTYEEAAANWFCKYGDLGYSPQVHFAFLKQKHRMIWERRHGKVGSGMKNVDPYKVEDDPREIH